ncbi:hypothetical protein HMPREF0602_0892 [Neisseria meningitidis ATCC 13091]|uniref:Uncharacterized protein n=1 Tax=Neisseria meningitidis serogroup B (strain ATCC 13091 / M2091) TaxID=862513 RepID=E0N8R2_NEIM3|nr:hypothetical protein HMPREF0602_0892 [Neisseria meningitidis ATCC 13091]
MHISVISAQARIQTYPFHYSGLTKTSTAVPRLAVLFVLFTASSPCPDFC